MHFLGAPTANDRFRLSWLIRALATMFRSEKALGLHESYEFRLEGEVFHAQVDDGEVQISEGPATDPAWIVTTDVGTFVGLGAGVIDPAEAAARGKATFWGELEAGMRSVELLGPHLGSLRGPGGMLGAVQDRVRPEAAAGLTERYEFRSADEAFHVDVARGEVQVRAGRATDPAFVFSAGLDILIAMYLGQLSVDEALTSAGAQLAGDPEAAARAWTILDLR